VANRGSAVPGRAARTGSAQNLFGLVAVDRRSAADWRKTPMPRAPRILIPAAFLAGCAALAGPALAQMQTCTSDGYEMEIPKGYGIWSVEYRQVQDPPVRATLWSERLGPRTIDNTVTATPKGDWTPVAIADPAEVTPDNHKTWKLGVDALFADGGDYSKSFECVAKELHPNGGDPWGYYILSYIPRESDPGQVYFQVRVILHRGPNPPPPKKPKTSSPVASKGK
jgi:hypothetical protein